MADVVETRTNGKTTTTTWWKTALNPQTVVWIIGFFAAGVIFWKNTTDNWDATRELGNKVKELANKAEIEAKIKSVDDKVNRQYENNGKINDRINDLEKRLEYERGVHDANSEKQADKK